MTDTSKAIAILSEYINPCTCTHRGLTLAVKMGMRLTDLPSPYNSATPASDGDLINYVRMCIDHLKLKQGGLQSLID